MSQTDPTPPPPHLGPVVFLLAIFAVIDLITPGVLLEMRRDWGLAILFGIIAGQSGFLAFWAVLGTQRLWVRFFGVLAVAVAFYLLLLLGIALSMAPNISRWEWETIGEFAAGILLVPLLSLPLMVPIWIFRWALGCRMVSRCEIEPSAQQPVESSRGEDDSGELSSARQFTLGQILAATTFVAVAFGLAGSYAKINAHYPGDTWTMLLTIMGVSLLASALVAPLCIWATLMVRNPMAAGISFVVQTAALGLALVDTGTRLWGSSPDEAVVDIFVFAGAATSTLFFSLGVVRFCGYELMWLRREKPCTGGPTRYKWMYKWMRLEPKSKPWPHDGMSPFAWLAIILLCIDLAAVLLAWSGMWPIYHSHHSIPVIGGRIISGLFVGQIAFLAVWTVFGPEPFWVRLLRSTGAALIPCGALIAFREYPFHRGYSIVILVSSFLFVPLFLFCTQLPVWIFRFSRGYSLTTKEQEDVPRTRTWQYELHHLFGITTITAVVLGLGTLGAELSSGIGFNRFHVPGVCIALSLWSSFIMLPCILITLSSRRQSRFGLWLVGVVVATTIILMAFFGMLSILFNLTAVAVLFGCLRFVGNRGYFLARPE